MADKEATIYIVDVGKSMGRKNHGRSVSDFDWAMTYVWDKITSTVSYNCHRSSLLLMREGGYGSQDGYSGRHWVAYNR